MWTRIAYGLIAVGAVVAIELTIGWSVLLKPWTRAAPSALLGALMLVLLTYLVRSARLFRYFRECREFRPCVRLFLVHNVFVNLLPLHAGEVSFPVLMKRYFAISANRSVSGLLWLRYLDFHTLILIALAALWLATPWPWVPAALLAWIALPVLTVAFWEAGSRFLTRYDHPVSTAIVDALKTLPTSRLVLVESWGWTALNWIIKIAAFAWILTIFSPMNFVDSLFGAAGGELSNILPVNMPAGIGTYQAGIVAATAPLGVKFHHAVIGGVNLHLFVLGVAIAGGLITLMIPRYAGLHRSAKAA